MEPITRKEEYYDGMINDTPVPDPILREEHFLKDLADKIAQGGGGGSRLPDVTSEDNGKVLGVVGGEWGKINNIPIFEEQSREIGGTTYNYTIQFDDVDYIEDDVHRQPFIVKSHKDLTGDTMAFVIPTKHGEICLNVFAQNSLKYIYPQKIADKTWAFKGQSSGIYVSVTYGAERYFRDVFQRAENQKSSVITYGAGDTEPYWYDAQTWWDAAEIKNLALVTDMTDAETTLNQAISGMKSLAGASPETTVAKYMTLPAAFQYAMTALIGNWETSLIENKKPVYMALNSGTFAITDVRYTAPLNESFATAVYKEIDFTNNKIYDMTITFNAQKLFFECTCHEATSLM